MIEDAGVVVIGGGAAGLAAAIEAKREVEDVMILERSGELGGILPQCIHTGFGLHYFSENLTGPEYISRLIQKARELRIGHKLNTMVLRISPDKKIVAVNDVDGLMTIQAKAIVLAMGCRERTRGALRIPGDRPAGIYTAGTAQRLMDLEGYMVGKRVVILGSGDVGLIMARRFAMENAKVEAVVEIAPYLGGLGRNMVQCLEDFDIPLLLQHTVTSIRGAGRVEAVTVARVDASWRPIPGTGREIKCDTLILSAGLIPENELSKTAGVVLDRLTGGPIVDEHMETSVRGIFACGNVVHVHDLVDHVSWAGEVAGRSAAKYVMGELPPPRKKVALKAGENVRYVVPQVISGEEEMALHLRAKKPMQDVKLRIGELTVPLRVVRPPELVMVKLTQEKIERVVKGDELTINIEES